MKVVHAFSLRRGMAIHAVYHKMVWLLINSLLRESIHVHVFYDLTSVYPCVATGAEKLLMQYLEHEKTCYFSYTSRSM